jgi:LEA14-like dessication related protein
MELRSSLFGSRLRAALVALLALLALVGVAWAAGVLGIPSVVGVENSFGTVTDSTTAVETTITVRNPNPVALGVGGLTANYTVLMNDVEMATGGKRGLHVEPGESTVSLTTTLDNDRIPRWWSSHLRRGERTAVRVEAGADLFGLRVGTTPVARTIETDVAGQFNSTERRPVNANVPLLRDPVAYVERTTATWGAVTDAESELDVAFVVSNPKNYPLVLAEVGYGVRMNDVEMGAGRTNREYVVPAGESRTVETTVTLENRRLSDWWVTHLRNNQVTDLRIDFTARVGPEGSTVEVPLRGLDYTKRIETDIFGTKPANDRSDGVDDPTTEDTTRRTTGDGRSTTTPGTLLPTTPGPVTVPQNTTDDGLL